MVVQVCFVTGASIEISWNSNRHNTLTDFSDDVAEKSCLPKNSLVFYHRGVPITPSSFQCSLLDAANANNTVTICAVRRLLGGKGGFGSNLRSAGKKEHGRTTNFDACRDLTGRRVRHVNQQKQMAEWAPGLTANPREVMHELSKKELSSLARKERHAEAERKKKAEQPSLGELRQRVLEEAMTEISKEQATIRQGTTAALQAALTRLPVKRPFELISADTEGDTGGDIDLVDAEIEDEDADIDDDTLMNDVAKATSAVAKKQKLASKLDFAADLDLTSESSNE